MALESDKIKKGVCKDCKKVFDKRELSQKGICSGCAKARVLQAIKDLKRKKGKYFKKWLKAIQNGIDKAKKEGV